MKNVGGRKYIILKGCEEKNIRKCDKKVEDKNVNEI